MAEKYGHRRSMWPNVGFRVISMGGGRMEVGRISWAPAGEAGEKGYWE
jgi:hypothetical protein